MLWFLSIENILHQADLSCSSYCTDTTTDKGETESRQIYNFKPFSKTIEILKHNWVLAEKKQK